MNIYLEQLRKAEQGFGHGNAAPRNFTRNAQDEQCQKCQNPENRGFDTFGTTVLAHFEKNPGPHCESCLAAEIPKKEGFGTFGTTFSAQPEIFAESPDSKCQKCQNPENSGFDTFGTTVPAHSEEISETHREQCQNCQNPTARSALATMRGILQGTPASASKPAPTAQAPLYITDAPAARQQVQQLLTEDVLAVDIETTGLDPHLHRVRVVSVATRSGKVVVFDLASVPAEVLQPLAARPWCVFNGSFEWRFLSQVGLRIPALHDVQLLDRLASHQMHRSLAEAARQWLGIELDKEQQRSDWSGPLSLEQIAYAAADAQITARLAVHLLKVIQTAGQRRLYDTWRTALPVLAGLELRGMSFDFDTHSRMLQGWERERDGLRIALKQHLGAGVSPTSGPQLGEWLKQHLPPSVVASWPKTATGRLQTDADTLALFADLPVVQPLLQFKRVAKLLSTYGSTYVKQRHPITGRLHPSFRIGQTRGGRMCASNPNVQNPPRLDTFRALFIPAPGRVLIGADYSQIELRVAALLSGDRAMLEAYARGQDLHRLTAAAVSGVAPDAVTKEQRSAAKAINFGNLYGQGPAGLARTAQLQYGVAMNKKQAAEALSRFAAAYPQLYLWKQQQIAEATQWRRVRTRLGLVRDFDAQGQGYLQGEACNIPVQGSAAEVLMCTLARLPQHLAGLDARLYHNIHDELLLEAAPDQADAAAAALQAAMVDGFLQVFPEGEALTADLVDVKQGRSWAEVH